MKRVLLYSAVAATAIGASQARATNGALAMLKSMDEGSCTCSWKITGDSEWCSPRNDHLKECTSKTSETSCREQRFCRWKPDDPIELLTSKVNEMEKAAQQEQLEDENDAKKSCSLDSTEVPAWDKSKFVPIQFCTEDSICATQTNMYLNRAATEKEKAAELRSKAAGHKLHSEGQAIPLAKAKSRLESLDQRILQYQRRKQEHRQSHDDAETVLRDIRQTLLNKGSFEASTSDKLALAREPLAEPIMRFLAVNSAATPLKKTVIDQMVKQLNEIIQLLRQSTEHEAEKYQLQLDIARNEHKEVEDEISKLQQSIDLGHVSRDEALQQARTLDLERQKSLGHFTRMASNCVKERNVYARETKARQSEVKLFRQIREKIASLLKEKDDEAAAALRGREQDNKKAREQEQKAAEKSREEKLKHAAQVAKEHEERAKKAKMEQEEKTKKMLAQKDQEEKQKTLAAAEKELELEKKQRAEGKEKRAKASEEKDKKVAATKAAQDEEAAKRAAAENAERKKFEDQTAAAANAERERLEAERKREQAKKLEIEDKTSLKQEKEELSKQVERHAKISPQLKQKVDAPEEEKVGLQKEPSEEEPTLGQSNQEPKPEVDREAVKQEKAKRERDEAKEEASSKKKIEEATKSARKKNNEAKAEEERAEPIRKASTKVASKAKTIAKKVISKVKTTVKKAVAKVKSVAKSVGKSLKKFFRL